MVEGLCGLMERIIVVMFALGAFWERCLVEVMTVEYRVSKLVVMVVTITAGAMALVIRLGDGMMVTARILGDFDN